MKIAFDPHTQVVVSTANLPENEWLDYRRQGIGGSDTGAVLGISPWTTGRDLYFDKLGIASTFDQESNWVQLETGHLLEPLIGRIFKEKTGYRVFQAKYMFRRDDHPFMLADVDFLIQFPDGTFGVLEAKTTNFRAIGKWKDDAGNEIVPPYYESQGRHYLAVLGLEHCYFVCLYGNSINDVIIRHITRDLAYEEELIYLEQDFWEHVQTKTPPPLVEQGELAIESARRLFSAADAEADAVLLPPAFGNQLERYLSLREQKEAVDCSARELKKEMQHIECELALQLGKSCNGLCRSENGVFRVNYPVISRTGIPKDKLARLQFQHPDVYAKYVTTSTSRRLRISLAGEDSCDKEVASSWA